MTTITHVAGRPVRAGLRFDATPRIGVGHGMRMLALAEELRSRGVEVVALGEVTVPWVAQLYDGLGVTRHTAPGSPREFARSCAALDLDHLALDRYDLPAGTGAALRSSGHRVLVMCDAQFGADQDGDVYVDQNYGADARQMGAGAHLVGPTYWLTRDAVRDRRRTPRRVSERPRMLAVFGGTDPFHAAEVVVPLALAPGDPVELVVVTPHTDTARALAALPLAAGQSLEVVAATDDLPALAATCDVAVSAAGSTVWELLCIGVPTALVAVADNQEAGYRATVAGGLVLGAGRLGRLHDESERATARDALHRLLTDESLRRHLARAGQNMFDGRGRVRVADTLLGAQD